VRKMSIGEKYVGKLTPMRSNISRFSRGATGWSFRYAQSSRLIAISRLILSRPIMALNRYGMTACVC
jgi:hypothetical protein